MLADRLIRIACAASTSTAFLLVIARPLPSWGASFVYQGTSSSGPVSFSLDPYRLFITADAVADTPGSFITADANISFALDEPAPISFTTMQTPGRFNRPLVLLSNLENGFVLERSYNGSPAISSCGSLSVDECFALAPAFSPSGAILPAGNYSVLFNLYAFYHVPGQGSCAVGCGSAGGSATVQIVPEPASIALLAAGLAWLATACRASRQQR